MKIKRTIRPQECAFSGCPGILVTDQDTVLVQGLKTAKPTEVDVPGHEDLVAIPRETFDRLVRQYIE